MSTADGSPIAALVDRAISQWGRPEQVQAILVKGSAGETGLVPLGGDLDLLVVSVDPPGDDWFAELHVDGVPIEIFVSGRFGEAAQSLSVALWHGAAATASAAATKPTTRRCLAVWVAAAHAIGVGGQVDLLDAAVGRRPSAAARTKLVALLTASDYRVAAAVEGMVQAGEERWAVYPILRSALWSPMAERHSEEVRQAVLHAVALDEAGLARRVGSARELGGYSATP